MSKIFVFLAGAAVGVAVMAVYYQAVCNRALDEIEDEIEKLNTETRKDIPRDYRTGISPVDTHLRRISEAEFGDENDYETGTLFYYQNGVITDSNNEPIDIYNDVLGFFTDFMSPEEETIYMRDDKLKIDYEVLIVDDIFGDEEGAVTT